MSDRKFVVGRPHFGRFTRTPGENAQAVAAARDALATAVVADPAQPGAADLLDAAVDLAEALTIAGREVEAVALAGPAVQLARDSDRTDTLGWALLALATAEHYAGLPTDAEPHFDEVAVARTGADRELEHHALHHLGRFLVDEGRTACGRGLHGVAGNPGAARRAPRREHPRRPGGGAQVSSVR